MEWLAVVERLEGELSEALTQQRDAWTRELRARGARDAPARLPPAEEHGHEGSGTLATGAGLLIVLVLAHGITA